MGFEVLPANPCDPRGRPANYPSLWLLPAPLGAGDDETVPLGILLAVVFFVAALAVTGLLTVREGVLYGIALCSPAVMLGVERGNPDLFIFALLAAALLALGRGAALTVVGYGLLFLATLLKLYPLFAWGMLLRRGRSTAIAACLLTGVGVFVALTFDELRTILEVVPREILFSYGARVLADGLAGSVDLDAGTPTSILAVALVVLGALAALAAGVRWRRGAGSFEEDRGLDAFWAGAGIYVGSYAVMHNYDYRLVFLLLTIPQLLRWSGNPLAPVPRASWILALLFASLLLAARPVDELSFEEFVNWFLFVGLGAAMVATIPYPRRATERSSGQLREPINDP